MRQENIRSPEVIRTVVMIYLKYPLSLWNVDDLLLGTRPILRGLIFRCDDKAAGCGYPVLDDIADYVTPTVVHQEITFLRSCEFLHQNHLGAI